MGSTGEWRNSGNAVAGDDPHTVEAGGGVAEGTCGCDVFDHSAVQSDSRGSARGVCRSTGSFIWWGASGCGMGEEGEARIWADAIVACVWSDGEHDIHDVAFGGEG